MQTRKNRKNKTFNLKNRGGGPKTKKNNPYSMNFHRQNHQKIFY